MISKPKLEFGGPMNHYHRYTILYHLENNGKASVARLANICGLSLTTVRKYLQFLDKEKLLKFTRGYAEKLPQYYTNVLQWKLTINKDAKEKIGKKAAEMVEDNDTIFIGGGTTVSYMLPHLADKKNLTVLSNSIYVLINIPLYPDITLVNIGGHWHPDTFTFTGNISTVYQSVHPRKAFLGASGIDPATGVGQGKSLHEQDECLIVDRAREVFFLADASKFGIPYPWIVVPPGKIQNLITDKKFSPAELSAWKSLGTRVIGIN